MTDSRMEPAVLPERIAGLTALARNVGWSWNRDGRGLFRSVDPTLWHLIRHNPFVLLRRVERERLTACAADPEFLARYDALLEQLGRTASDEGTWLAGMHPELRGQAVAYFCAEFGLHNSVPIYSGGLGILAGDHCKAASDLGMPLIRVGLLYSRGYFDQRLRPDGWQEEADERFDPTVTPLDTAVGPRSAPSLVSAQAGGYAE